MLKFDRWKSAKEKLTENQKCLEQTVSCVLTSNTARFDQRVTTTHHWNQRQRSVEILTFCLAKRFGEENWRKTTTPLKSRKKLSTACSSGSFAVDDISFSMLGEMNKFRKGFLSGNFLFSVKIRSEKTAKTIGHFLLWRSSDRWQKERNIFAVIWRLSDRSAQLTFVISRTVKWSESEVLTPIGRTNGPTDSDDFLVFLH